MYLPAGSILGLIFYEYFFPKNLQLEIIFKSLFVLFASIYKMLADTNSITSSISIGDHHQPRFSSKAFFQFAQN